MTKKAENKTENVFELINLASKRVKELVSGSPKLIQSEIEDPIQIALEEIKQRKIKIGKKQTVDESKKSDN